MTEVPAIAGKVRRVSDAYSSSRQHIKGLALLASEADSGESRGGAGGSAAAKAALVYSQVVATLQVSNVCWISTAGAVAQISRQSSLQLASRFWLHKLQKLLWPEQSFTFTHRIFQLVSWCQKIQMHCSKSCGLACVTLLVTLHGKGRCISCSCEFP